MVTLSFGRLRFRPECVVILGVRGLHGLMFLILILRRFAFFKRLISAKPEFSPPPPPPVALARYSIYLSPPKISGISSTQKYFTRAYVYMKISKWGVFLHSYTRCPRESDKTGVMKIATKERGKDNDVIVYIVIGDAYQIFQQTLSKNNHRVDSLNISVISGYLVYLYTLTVFHRK